MNRSLSPRAIETASCNDRGSCCRGISVKVSINSSACRYHGRPHSPTVVVYGEIRSPLLAAHVESGYTVRIIQFKIEKAD